MTKQWKCYDKKPEKIRNAKDLLRFFKAIPAGKWCVRALEKGESRCAMGHLNAAYNGSAYDWGNFSERVDGFKVHEIVSANNGDYTDVGTGNAIKSRVVNFIKANIDR